MWRMKFRSGSGRPAPGTITICDRFSRSSTSELPVYHYESLADFVHHRFEVSAQEHFLRVNDVVCTGSRRWPREADGFPQPALHAVALNCSAQGSAHRESDAEPGSNFRLGACNVWLPTLQVEHGHRGREMPPSLLVHALEIRMAQQPGAAGKSRLHPHPTLIRC